MRIDNLNRWKPVDLEVSEVWQHFRLQDWPLDYDAVMEHIESVRKDLKKDTAAWHWNKAAKALLQYLKYAYVVDRRETIAAHDTIDREHFQAMMIACEAKEIKRVKIIMRTWALAEDICFNAMFSGKMFCK